MVGWLVHYLLTGVAFNSLSDVGKMSISDIISVNRLLGSMGAIGETRPSRIDHVKLDILICE